MNWSFSPKYIDENLSFPLTCYCITALKFILVTPKVGLVKILHVKMAYTVGGEKMFLITNYNPRFCILTP